MAPKSMLQRLSLVCLISSTVPSASALSAAITAAQALGVLEARDLTCSNSSATACSTIDSRLPGNICCTSGSSCISVDSGSSAICCPSGQNCQQIQAISCNVGSQDPAAFPDSAIQTTKLSSTLPKCGINCCPFGYTCDTADSLCKIIISTSSLARNVTTTSKPSPSSTSTASGIDSTTSQTPANCTKFPAAAVAVGFFPGVLAGILLAILLVLLCGGHRRGSASHSFRPASDNSSTFKTHARNLSNKFTISDPIPLETQSARSDFLSRTTTRARSIWSKKSPRLNEESNTWKMPTPPVPNNVPMVPVNGLIPVTPERQVQVPSQMYGAEGGYGSGGNAAAAPINHQPSTESIRVYSPHNMTRTSNTNPNSNGATPVAPLRGMTSQRTDSAYGSPFKTPERKIPVSEFNYNEPPATRPSPYETLTPARYGEANKPDLRSKKGQVSRPTTTFTEMLNEIDFPDPMGSGRGVPPVPGMPPVPKGLDFKEKGAGKGGPGARGEWR